ncbi:ribonuclease H-like domain-containing protein [Tanacetum coccineum]
MWLFRHKHLADGTLSRYKARLVANGSTQLAGVNVDETFSLVVKPATIQTVLSLATSRHWLVHQLDVRNAFLHGDLSETVYMHQPLEVRDSAHPDYVDDIVLTTSSEVLLQQLIRSLHLDYDGSCRTPVDNKSKLGADGALAMQKVCLHMHDPREPHFSAQKRILSRSSVEAEYCGVANVVVETCWLQNLLRELHTPLSSATLVYCDNVRAVYLSSNPVQHQRTKHVEIDLHFVRDLLAAS